MSRESKEGRLVLVAALFLLSLCFVAFFEITGRQVSISTTVSPSEFDPWAESYAQWLMTFFAMLASLTGLLGVVWIKQTLEATRATAVEARRANEIARDMGRAQMRAYVGVSHAELLDAPDELGFKAVIIFQNFGQTPAHNVQARWRCKTVGAAVLDSFDKSLTSVRPTDPANMGAGMSFSLDIDNVLARAEVEILKTGEAFTVIVGDVSYHDVFGEPIRTTRFQMRVVNFGLPNARLLPWGYADQAD